MALKRYIVILDSTDTASLADIVARLRSAGLDVTRQLDALGMLVGEADEAQLAGIRAVAGVVSVEEEQDVEVRASDDEGE